MIPLKGQRWTDTLALWINLAFWLPRRLYWRLRLGSWTAALRKLGIYRKTYWFYWPIPLQDRLYRWKELWIPVEGFGYLRNHEKKQDFPSDWLQALRYTQVGLDIGAHRGYWTLYYKSHLPPMAKVLLFEPGAENYAHLVRNLQINHAYFATPFRLALWEEKMLVELTLPTSQGSKAVSEASWIYEYSTLQVKPQKGEVMATTLDAFLQALPVEALTWIKIDTEGAEVAILRGARETLRRFRPTLWIEVHDTWAELHSLLQEYDYLIKAQTPPEQRGRGHIWAEPSEKASPVSIAASLSTATS